MAAFLVAVAAALVSGCAPQHINRETALRNAACKGDQQRVEALIKAGASVNAANAAGETPLHLAAREGHAATVELLLRHGADPNLPASDGKTPMHYAALAMSADVMTKMRTVGAGNPFAVDRWGQMPVHIAAYSGRTSVLPLLLAKGGAGLINQPDADGETALFKAASRGEIAVMRELLSRGADPNVPRKPQPGNKSPNGDPPIVKAAREEQDLSIRTLIAAKADVNAHGEDGFTALHISAGKNRLKIARELLAAGAEINATNIAGDTPLHRAAARGKLEALRFLLKQKPPADVNARNKRGATPLLAAAAEGVADVCEVLLAAGADPKAVDEDGNTALHHAVSSENSATVALLVERGLDRAAKNKEGKTPAQLTTNERLLGDLSGTRRSDDAGD